MLFQAPSLSSSGWPKHTAQMARSRRERMSNSTPSMFAFRISTSMGAFSFNDFASWHRIIKSRSSEAMFGLAADPMTTTATTLGSCSARSRKEASQWKAFAVGHLRTERFSIAWFTGLPLALPALAGARFLRPYIHMHGRASYSSSGLDGTKSPTPTPVTTHNIAAGKRGGDWSIPLPTSWNGR